MKTLCTQSGFLLPGTNTECVLLNSFSELDTETELLEIFSIKFQNMSHSITLLLLPKMPEFFLDFLDPSCQALLRRYGVSLDYFCYVELSAS